MRPVGAPASHPDTIDDRLAPLNVHQAAERLHDREAVHLFCVETLGAQIVTPEAVCLLEP